MRFVGMKVGMKHDRLFNETDCGLYDYVMVDGKGLKPRLPRRVSSKLPSSCRQIPSSLKIPVAGSPYVIWGVPLRIRIGSNSAHWSATCDNIGVRSPRARPES